MLFLEQSMWPPAGNLAACHVLFCTCILPKLIVIASNYMHSRMFWNSSIFKKTFHGLKKKCYFLDYVCFITVEVIKVLLAISLVLHWQASKSSIVFWRHKCFSKQHITNHISICYSECTFIHEISLKFEHHVTFCTSSSPFILSVINLLFKIFSLITHFMLSVHLSVNDITHISFGWADVRHALNCSSKGKWIFTWLPAS